MGGLKNIYQHYGATPHSPVTGADPLERSIQMQTRPIPAYCALCGGEIIEASTDASGKSVDWQWEKQYQLHSRCYQMHRKR